MNRTHWKSWLSCALIRAVKTGKRKDNQEAIESCENALHITPTLGQLLDELRGAE